MSSASPVITPLLHVDAAHLTADEFRTQFVDKNLPVIIDNALADWFTTEGKNAVQTATTASSRQWTVEELARVIGDTVMTNIFVSNNQRRFKFYKQQTQTTSATNTKNEATAAASTSAAAAAASSSSSPPVPSSPSSPLPDAGLSRASMTFNEFIRCSSEAIANQSHTSYYVRRQQ